MIAAIRSGAEPGGKLPEGAFHKWLEEPIRCSKCEVTYNVVAEWDWAASRWFAGGVARADPDAKEGGPDWARLRAPRHAHGNGRCRGADGDRLSGCVAVVADEVQESWWTRVSAESSGWKVAAMRCAGADQGGEAVAGGEGFDAGAGESGCAGRG